MEDYNTVVKTRYDKEDVTKRFQNQYALINPIGFHGLINIQTMFFSFIKKLRIDGIDMNTITVLDAGCGMGFWTRYWAELLYSNEKVTGFDLSETRINHARTMSPSIKYSVSDILTYSSKDKFTIIFALDVFMHLKTEKDIILGLENLSNLLDAKGYFLWYEPYAANHFVSKENAEGQGFSKKQMITLAEKAGLFPVWKYSMFKQYLGRYHTVYFYKKFPSWFIRLIELIPGKPGNIAIAFQKKR